GWLRAITKIAGNAALDTPGRVDLLTKIGTVGNEWVKDELGRMPDFLAGLIPIGRSRGGQHTVLSTQGLNPFATIPQVLSGAGGLVAAKPGQTGKALAQLGLNPLF